MKQAIAAALLAFLLITQAAAPAAAAPDAARQILENMTLEEKVGQMFMARCPDSYAHTTAAEYHLGGYVMFAKDFENRSRAKVIERIETIQAENAVPLLLAVDEEGGTVTRVSRFKALREKKFASPQALYQKGGLDAIVQDAKEKSEFLLSLGVNVNLAPVADVSTDAGDFIHNRTLGKDAQSTAEYVAAVVRQMKKSGIGSALKHFPGYGNNKDTHTGVAVDERPYETFVSSDFLPFSAGIEAGADCVLVSHNIVACLDAENPASLSYEVHRVLREELGFTGVALTDDLNMDAISKQYGKAEAAVLAVLAGNDMILTGAYKTQIPAVIEAVREGRIDESRIDESALRVLEWKESLGLI